MSDFRINFYFNLNLNSVLIGQNWSLPINAFFASMNQLIFAYSIKL